MRRASESHADAPDASADRVVVPARPGCTFPGATIKRGIANARMAGRGHVAALEALGEPAPAETTGPTLVSATAAL